MVTALEQIMKLTISFSNKTDSGLTVGGKVGNDIDADMLVVDMHE